MYVIRIFSPFLKCGAAADCGVAMKAATVACSGSGVISAGEGVRTGSAVSGTRVAVGRFSVIATGSGEGDGIIVGGTTSQEINITLAISPIVVLMILCPFIFISMFLNSDIGNLILLRILYLFSDSVTMGTKRPGLVMRPGLSITDQVGLR
jgi:hypothetical protein